VSPYRLENLGDGTFRSHKLTDLPEVARVRVADVNRDGDPDSAAGSLHKCDRIVLPLLGNDAVPAPTLRLIRQLLHTAFAVENHRTPVLNVEWGPV
jgi:hypothetical protein